MGKHYIKKVFRMSLLEQCRVAYERLYERTGVTCSVVRLCNTHNLEIAKEMNEREKNPKLFTKRVHELFGKPVVEESRNGKTLCLICELE